MDQTHFIKLFVASQYCTYAHGACERRNFVLHVNEYRNKWGSEIKFRACELTCTCLFVNKHRNAIIPPLPPSFYHWIMIQTSGSAAFSKRRGTQPTIAIAWEQRQGAEVDVQLDRTRRAKLPAVCRLETRWSRDGVHSRARLWGDCVREGSGTGREGGREGLGR